MQIEFSRDIEQFVNAQVMAGEYASPQDLPTEAVRLMMQRQAMDAFIDQGLAGAGGEVAADQVWAQLDAVIANASRT